MAFFPLRFPLKPARRRPPLDRADVRAAFVRAARRRWGGPVPCEVRDVRRGTVVIVTPSAPWRAELLWSADALLMELTEDLACRPGYFQQLIVRLG